ncbi:TPA: hypothetical protein EYN09_14405 [Candidatus Poribacteria bacterium]|nr:hypothetical protein [Candidatus Poribacteria bacterium]
MVVGGIIMMLPITFSYGRTGLGNNLRSEFNWSIGARLTAGSHDQKMTLFGAVAGNIIPSFLSIEGGLMVELESALEKWNINSPAIGVHESWFMGIGVGRFKETGNPTYFFSPQKQFPGSGLSNRSKWRFTYGIGQTYSQGFFFKKNESFLFNVESHSDLEEGIVSDNLRQEFKNDKGIVLTENYIIKNQDGNWWIGNKNNPNRYIVKKEFLFLTSLKFIDALGNGILPDELGQEFEKNGISLDFSNTIVSPSESKKSEWLIKDKETEQAYVISKEMGGLNIYEINSYSYRNFNLDQKRGNAYIRTEYEQISGRMAFYNDLRSVSPPLVILGDGNDNKETASGFASITFSNRYTAKEFGVGFDNITDDIVNSESSKDPNIAPVVGLTDATTGAIKKRKKFIDQNEAYYKVEGLGISLYRAFLMLNFHSNKSKLGLDVPGLDYGLKFGIHGRSIKERSQDHVHKNVKSYAFRIEGSEAAKYKIDLDKNIISDELRKQFGENKDKLFFAQDISLSQNCDVIQDDNGWQIEDRSKRFFYYVSRDGKELDVYLKGTALFPNTEQTKRNRIWIELNGGSSVPYTSLRP